MIATAKMEKYINIFENGLVDIDIDTNSVKIVHIDIIINIDVIEKYLLHFNLNKNNGE